MPWKSFACLAALLAPLLGAAPAAAQSLEIKPDEAVKMRQGLMTAIDWQFRNLGAVAKREEPIDEKTIKMARDLTGLVRVAPQGFGVPSATVPGSRAKPAVWTNSGRFATLFQDLVTESERLMLAAQTLRVGEVEKQFLVVERLCKDCHDLYRSE